MFLPFLYLTHPDNLHLFGFDLHVNDWTIPEFR